MVEITAAPVDVKAAAPVTDAAATKVEEPENALTQKFTDAERKALAEFRTKLPEAVTKAYNDAPEPKPQNIQLWGVTIEPSGSPTARGDVVLMKFLRARNLNATEAESMLVSTLRWRQEFKVDEVMKEEFPKDIFGSLGVIYGKDKTGHPVTYNLYGANKDLKAVFGDVDRFIRWRVQLMEKGVALMDFEKIDQMVQVHDYEGVGLSSRDANSKRAASEATSIFQNYYPEMLYKKFFVNVPTIFTWIFWLFKPMVSAQTLAKMSVVGSGPQVIGKELLPLIDAKELPKRYGGEAEAF